jgi:hypothetical protein
MFGLSLHPTGLSMNISPRLIQKNGLPDHAPDLQQPYDDQAARE